MKKLILTILSLFFCTKVMIFASLAISPFLFFQLDGAFF